MAWKSIRSIFPAQLDEHELWLDKALLAKEMGHWDYAEDIYRQLIGEDRHLAEARLGLRAIDVLRGRPVAL